MLRAVSRGPGLLWSWKLHPCQKSPPQPHPGNTNTPFEETERLTGEKPVTSGPTSWIVPAPSKPTIWYGQGDAFVVVGIVVVDAAADFDVDGVYGAGTYSFKLSLNILEFPVRRVGWAIIVCT